MNDLNALTKKIEVDFLKAVSEELEHGTVNTSIVKKSAKDFLALLPFNSQEDIENKIGSFVQEYPELKKIHAILLTYIDEEKTVELLEKIRTYIHKIE